MTNISKEELYLIISIILAIITLFLSFYLYFQKKRYNLLKESYNTLEKNTLIHIERYKHLEQNLEQLDKEKISLSDSLHIAEQNLNTLQATSRLKEESLNEKITYLEKIKEDLTLKFKDISNEIIKQQHDTFSKSQQTTLTQVLDPFKEQLKSFKQEVNEARTESIKHKSNLDAQLTNLLNLNKTLSIDAQNLTQALKGTSKTQGNWGECQLARILEISGLRKDQDYETQLSFTDDSKKLYRPDVIIHLPNNRDIIIDSKVSLKAYLDATSTDNDIERIQYLQKNLSDIKNHIDELSTKEYQKLLKERTLNYVIMFIPVESAYIAALESDKNLYDYAYKRNIILATPLSLLPTLRTVENLWQIDAQNQNVQKIAELGGKIYDKLASFVEDMRSIDRALNQASNAYNNAMTKLQGKGSAISCATKMKELGSKTNKTINLTLNDDSLLLEDNSTIKNQGDDNA